MGGLSSVLIQAHRETCPRWIPDAQKTTLQIVYSFPRALFILHFILFSWPFHLFFLLRYYLPILFVPFHLGYGVGASSTHTIFNPRFLHLH